MDAIAVVAGLVTFLLVVGLARAYRLLPWSRACPECERPTLPYRRSGWPAILAARLHWRWCTSCGWMGLRRTRPPLTEESGEPLGHESGFRWGRPDSTSAPVFEWKEPGGRKETARRKEGKRKGKKRRQEG